jgi:hypothetical protein
MTGVAAAVLAVVTGAGGMGPGADPRPLPVPDDPNLYAAAVDTEVTYDNAVASTYDDGYGPRAYAQFEAALAPFGTWIDDPELGRVWTPSPAIVGAAFAPYASNGRWVLTEYGWTWDSGWSWGWAPFHYGRWAMRSNGAGRWCWIPGTLWGPAWVSWRAGRDYVGWAPLAPRGMSLGRPLGTRSPWRFVRAGALGAPKLELVPLRAIPSIFGRTTVVSRARRLAAGGVEVTVPVGPAAGKAGGSPPTLAPLVEVARGARPQRPIEPRLGAPLQSRPWIAAHATTQTPIVRWPSAGPPDGGARGPVAGPSPNRHAAATN